MVRSTISPIGAARPPISSMKASYPVRASITVVCSIGGWPLCASNCSSHWVRPSSVRPSTATDGPARILIQAIGMRRARLAALPCSSRAISFNSMTGSYHPAPAVVEPRAGWLGWPFRWPKRPLGRLCQRAAPRDPAQRDPAHAGAGGRPGVPACRDADGRQPVCPTWSSGCSGAGWPGGSRWPASALSRSTNSSSCSCCGWRAARDSDFPRYARFANAFIETSLPSVIILDAEPAHGRRRRSSASGRRCSISCSSCCRPCGSISGCRCGPAPSRRCSSSCWSCWLIPLGAVHHRRPSTR